MSTLALLSGGHRDRWVRTFARTPMISPMPKICRFCTSPGKDMPRRGEMFDRNSHENWRVAEVEEPWRLVLYTLDLRDWDWE